MKKNRWMAVCAAAVCVANAAGCSDDAASKFPMNPACGLEVCQENEVCVEETCVPQTPEDQNDPGKPEDQNDKPEDQNDKPEDQNDKPDAQNEPQDFIQVTCDTTSVTENGDKMATCSVVLSSKPSADVTVTITPEDDTELAVSTDTVTFTPEDWDQAQTVIISGKADDLIDGAQKTNVVLSATSDDAHFNHVEVKQEIETIDSDTPTLKVTCTPDQMKEGETSSCFLSLNGKPDADVTVTISSSDADELDVSTDTVTFTPENWDQAQTVTISGKDDHIVDGEKTTDVVFQTASDDDRFDALEQKREITIQDSNTAALQVTCTAASVLEGSSEQVSECSVVLTSKPSADVKISIEVKGEKDKVSVSETTLTFSAEHWDQPQTVTISGNEDADDKNDTVTIVFGMSSEDPNFISTDENGKFIDKEITVIDNDKADIVLGFKDKEGRDNTVFSGSDYRATAHVSLTTQPDSDVTVTLTTTNHDTACFQDISCKDKEITCLDASCEDALCQCKDTIEVTFTKEDWSTPKSVLVNGDPEKSGNAVSTPTITATSGGNYTTKEGSQVAASGTLTLKVFDKKDFLYTGELQEVTLLPGKYRLEVYGSDGRIAKWEQVKYASSAGMGGYAAAEYTIEDKEETLYICVGGNTYHEATSSGGYNGGGLGHGAGRGQYTNIEVCPADVTGKDCERYKTRFSNGGGASHIATTKQGEGLLKDYGVADTEGKDHKDDVLIVAGGGGGQEWGGTGGSGGGNEGGSGTVTTYAPGFDPRDTIAKPGTQAAGGESSPFADTTNHTLIHGSFGVGGYGYRHMPGGNDYGAGGGGGWYGGGGTAYVGSAGGGSGHIGKLVTNGEMKNGDSEVQKARTEAANHAGFKATYAFEPYDTGFARITLLVPEEASK